MIHSGSRYLSPSASRASRKFTIQPNPESASVAEVKHCLLVPPPIIPRINRENRYDSSAARRFFVRIIQPPRGACRCPPLTLFTLPFAHVKSLPKGTEWFPLSSFAKTSSQYEWNFSDGIREIRGIHSIHTHLTHLSSSSRRLSSLISSFERPVLLIPQVRSGELLKRGTNPAISSPAARVAPHPDASVNYLPHNNEGEMPCRPFGSSLTSARSRRHTTKPTGADPDEPRLLCKLYCGFHGLPDLLTGSCRGQWLLAGICNRPPALINRIFRHAGCI